MMWIFSKVSISFPNGMAYNSYAIIDDKIAIMDTIDKKKTEEWLANIDAVLSGRKLDYLAVPPAMFTSRQGSYNSTGGRKPDYLIIQHMEPDHSASIKAFLEKYGDVTVVANVKTFQMIRNFFGLDLENQKLVVENGGTLSLGRHNLTFVFAPMVHWPEVMVTYDSTDKVSSLPMASENSVRWMQRKTGMMRHADILSESSENMARRFRSC